MSTIVYLVHTDTYGNRTIITSIRDFISISFQNLPEFVDTYIEMITRYRLHAWLHAYLKRSLVQKEIVKESQYSFSQNGDVSLNEDISLGEWLLTLTDEILTDAGVDQHSHRTRFMLHKNQIERETMNRNIKFKENLNLDNYYMPGTGGHTRPTYGLAGKITGKIIKYNSIDNSFNIRVDTSNDIIFNVKADNFRGIPESDQRAGSRNKRRRKKHTKRSKRSKRSKRTKRSRR